jgi:hypothetical protein
MIFGTLVVNSIELGDSGVGSNQVSVSQEPPNLLEGHGKGLFTLVGLNLPGINSVPLF